MKRQRKTKPLAVTRTERALIAEVAAMTQTLREMLELLTSLGDKFLRKSIDERARAAKMVMDYFAKSTPILRLNAAVLAAAIASITAPRHPPDSSDTSPGTPGRPA